MKKILFALLITINTLSYAQSLNIKVNFYRCTNYDFDLNQPTGALINQQSSFLIDYNSNGIGKFIFLSNVGSIYQSTQKFVYSIEKVYNGKYSDGSRYIELYCNDEWNLISKIRLAIVEKNNKIIIKSIAIINENNEGSLFY